MEEPGSIAAVIEAAHKATATVGGSMATTLAKRSISKATILGWAKALHEVARLLEETVK